MTWPVLDKMTWMLKVPGEVCDQTTIWVGIGGIEGPAMGVPRPLSGEGVGVPPAWMRNTISAAITSAIVKPRPISR